MMYIVAENQERLCNNSLSFSRQRIEKSLWRIRYELWQQAVLPPGTIWHEKYKQSFCQCHGRKRKASSGTLPGVCWHSAEAGIFSGWYKINWWFVEDPPHSHIVSKASYTIFHFSSAPIHEIDHFRHKRQNQPDGSGHDFGLSGCRNGFGHFFLTQTDLTAANQPVSYTHLTLPTNREV